MYVVYNVDSKASEKIMPEGISAIKNVIETISPIRLGKNCTIS